MSNKFLLCLLCICFSGNLLLAQQKLSKSDMVKLDFKMLAATKDRLHAKDKALMPAYEKLIKDANGLLKYKPVSVMEKSAIPPSGDKHDYMSIAPYWWPDTASINGLPYIRKDGEVNPEVKDYSDKENMPKLCENIYLLSLAYYFSEDEQYAAHASKLLKVWFLDSATKMNPNLNFGQAIKGKINGRAEGLIDSRHFIFVIDALGLLKKSNHWTPQNQKEMKQWFVSFLSWMQTSEIGLDEKNAKNNHGVWYDAQRLSIALYLGDKLLAKEIIASAAGRLDKQSDMNGSFPLEMERTTSLHYTVFVLNAFLIVGQLSEEAGVDFWTLKTTSGKSIQQSFDAVLPYITKEKNWTGNQIKPFGFRDAFPLLLRGSTKLQCSSCRDAIKKIAEDQYESLLLNLL
jgi:hypothetical protein